MASSPKVYTSLHSEVDAFQAYALSASDSEILYGRESQLDYTV